MPVPVPATAPPRRRIASRTVVLGLKHGTRHLKVTVTRATVSVPQVESKVVDSCATPHRASTSRCA